jgi:hypothetical protein
MIPTKKKAGGISASSGSKSASRDERAPPPVRCLRRLAAFECADRRADSRCIHAGANFFQAHGDPVRPGWGEIFRTGAGDLLQRARRNSAAPVQSIMVFDLGGISHFTKQNQFPVRWSESESAQLLNTCYQPTQWDIYWRLEPCDFVMRKIEREEKLFGTPAIMEDWARAVIYHPLAYIQHRPTFMWNFLAGQNLTMWIADVEHPTAIVFPDRPAFAALISLHDLLKPTPLFRVGSWLLVCITVCGLAWRRRETPEGVFALGVCGSAAIYVLSFFAVGVASDFRYGYWAVLAGIAGGVVASLGRCKPQLP